MKIMTDYWIERDRTLGRLPDHGAGRRPGRDRQGRRQHRLGRRVRQAARRPAVGRARCPGPPPTAAAAPRRRRPTPTSRSAASTATTSAAARSRPTWTPSTARSTRSREQLGVDRVEAARGIVRIANNNMINALKLVSRQPRLRPARLHARRLRRRRRHARRRARRRARDPQGGDPARAPTCSRPGGC